ncbi:MAG: uracil-DNA glycosylase, partial [Planctomycetota bacterium]|nr:uracil-DNA glycosylase [Planctomycetota bacterium]
MWRDDLWRYFQQRLFTLDVLRLPISPLRPLFNPWRDCDPLVDLPQADAIRRENLRSYLESFPQRPEAVIVGEAPGPWDCRFSGIPITAERSLHAGGIRAGDRTLFQGRRSSRDVPAAPLARRAPFQSPSSAIFWGIMAEHHPRFLIWNCVPLHPYLPGRPLSVRTPTPAETAYFTAYLGDLLAIVQPRLVVAMGRKAEQSLGRLEIACRYIRHPSMGGAPAFREG